MARSLRIVSTLSGLTCATLRMVGEQLVAEYPDDDNEGARRLLERDGISSGIPGRPIVTAKDGRLLFDRLNGAGIPNCSTFYVVRDD